MVLSFKVSKTGTRYRPKPVVSLPDNAPDEVSENPKESSNNESSARKVEGDISKGGNASSISGSFISENEVSFTLNLYLDGYSIGKASETEFERHGSLQDSQRLLHPYDRTSETLFSAIESGRLPGDLLDGIPFKYVNGSLICEVRDYRKCASDQGSSIPTMVGLPTVHEVCLKMSLENIVKDIPLISDNSWTYGDLMEVESRILKALQPQLCLDPTPKLDRLCNNPVPTRLNLDLSSLRRKRLRQIPEVTVTTNSRIHGKKVCIDRVPESSNSRFGDSVLISGNAIPQHVQENLTMQNLSPSNMLAFRARSFATDGNVSALPLVAQQTRYTTGAGTPRNVQDQASGGLINMSGASPSGQDMTIAYGDNVNAGALLNGKREHQDGEMSPLSNFNKRARLSSVGPDGIQPQQIGSHVDSPHASDINWKNSLLQQQAMARGIQYVNAGLQKYPPQMFEGLMNQNSGPTSYSAGQTGLRTGPKEEQFELEKLDSAEPGQVKNDIQMETETGHLDMHHSRLQHRLPPNLMRSNFAPGAWNNISQDFRKEEQLQKRKSVQSPRLSAGAMAQSPLSSKSGEFSSGSAGTHFGAAGASGGPGSSQKEKSGVLAVGGMQSNANDSLQRQHQAVTTKRRSNSLPKTPVMSNVGSPASVSNISVPLSANTSEQTIVDRFSKIETVTMRYQLNSKKNKVEDWPVRKPITYSPQKLSACLSSLTDNEEFKDDVSTRQLSKSLLGGSVNVCKTRVMNFVLADRVLQGNQVALYPRFRTTMMMSEKPNDGRVAMHYGDTEDGNILSAEDYLPLLPNTHVADLLATQFCTLMIREGYLVDDNIQLRPISMNIAQPNSGGIPSNNPGMELKQHSEAASSQPSNDVKPTLLGNAAPHNLLANSRVPPHGNPQALQMSQGLLSGVSVAARQQMDPHPSLQQLSQQPTGQHSLIHQQQSQFQRSSMALPLSPHSHLNAMGQNSSMQLGNHMVNKSSALQLQLLQQQQQQLQQQQQQPQQQQQQQQQPQQQQQAQQQPQLQQRKMIMGLGTAMGIGNVGNNMVSLGGFGNAMGIGGARGIGGPGMSGPMTPISGMSNVGQTPMSLGQISNITNAFGQQLRNGQMTQAQAAAALMQSKLRRGILGGPQAAMSGMPGARQMHPSSAGLSMLGQSLNRANMNTMQRTAMGPMGPPKLMASMNLYMNQQQQHQQLQLQQQQLQQQQLQQLQHQQLQQQQQQESTSSSLQAVVSPSQVGSPSTMGMPQLNQPQQQQQPQQQPSPQQMSQRTPMSPQLSSGAIHAAMSAGNPEACPASPQLSSQTLGSVGSITNSPMELQGVNKSSSVNNT